MKCCKKVKSAASCQGRWMGYGWDKFLCPSLERQSTLIYDQSKWLTEQKIMSLS